MSRAFTKEDDSNSSIDVGERPISPHRNLVTEKGLAHIDAELAAAHEALAKGNAEADRDLIARASRDLRYWNARRESAEVSRPDPHSDVVRFGMTVTIADEDDKITNLGNCRRGRSGRQPWQDFACVTHGEGDVR